MGRSLNLNAIPSLPSLKEVALSAIKTAILTKQMEPGVVYTEAAVAKELGISRTPVREALIHLGSRGFLTLVPRKGFQLKILKEKDVRDLFEFRSALETAVIRHITPTLTDEAIREIQSLVLNHVDAATAGDSLKSVDADRAFHLYLAELTNNPYLTTAIEEVRDLIDLTGIKTLEYRNRAAESVKEHKAICEKLRMRSSSGAIQKMEEHIRTTEKRVLDQIKTLNNHSE